LRADASTLPANLRRTRPRSSRLVWRWALLVFVLLAVGAALLSFAFAGSPSRLAEGTRVAGVDVGGLTPAEARKRLEQRAATLAGVPIAFVAGSDRFALTPRRLGIEVDWAAAVDAARREGAGFGPVRGLRRLQMRVFGVDVAPPVRVYTAALAFEVSRIEREVAATPREASLVLRGLKPVVVPQRAGLALERRAAEGTIVRALAGFSRADVALPVQVEAPTTTAAELRPALRQARIALGAPVRLTLNGTRWRLPRWRVAELLQLPAGGETALRIGGAGADRYFERLEAVVGRPPQDATFVPGEDGTVSVSPAKPGLALNRAATERRLFAAAISPTRRLARVSVVTAQPELTTAEAKGLGVTSVLASYWTPYAGTPDRIRNLQLAVGYLDGARIAPGETFSFNAEVGERTEERGFRPAPVIVRDEYEEAVGGGVSQVATTVFNAAWEAGLKITARAPHSLYISRYEAGRDATVNYPDLDLRFLNDTGRWLVVRGFSGDSGITISILGAPTGRRVESVPGELRITGPVPVQEVRDPTLTVGEQIVEEEGSPPQSIVVRRTVYDADGDVLYAETWTTAYRGEKRVVRVGSKPKPREPEPEPKAKPKDEEEEPPPVTTTGPTETEPPPPAPPG
jgi:vancomycin resistance protein YoaR